MRVERLHKRCIAAPSVWQGITDKGEIFYATFTKGKLKAGIIENKNNTHQIIFKQTLFNEKIFTEENDYLEDILMIKYLQGVVKFKKDTII